MKVNDLQPDMPIGSVRVSISVDASELKADIERIENGELTLPTVSAIHVYCDGVFEEDIPLWLPEG